MNIVVFGSTGNTGQEITKKMLSAGHKVTAFARTPSRIKIDNENLKVITGDIHNTAAVNKAVENKDAVIIALGAGQSLSKTTVRSEGTANVIQAMKENNVKRLVTISAMGVGESWKDLSVMNRLFFATLLKNSRSDHEAQELHIKRSNLDWTIIRPSGLTDDPGTGIYMYGADVRSKTSKIPRADIAHLVLKSLEDDSSFIGKALTITN